jgi:ribosomal protein L37E
MKTLCGHCGSTSFDDRRGNCSCCGAPRPLPEYIEWRAEEMDGHPNCRCDFEIPAGSSGDTFAIGAADMEWVRYRGKAPCWSTSVDIDTGTFSYVPG